MKEPGKQKQRRDYPKYYVRGELITINAACRKYGIPQGTIYQRMRRDHVSLEDALIQSGMDPNPEPRPLTDHDTLKASLAERARLIDTQTVVMALPTLDRIMHGHQDLVRQPIPELIGDDPGIDVPDFGV